MKVNLARLLIGLVVFFNLQAALAFLINPQAYAPAFQLSAVPGESAVRGIGVLFVMWNIPYLVALWNPRKNRTALHEALAMQAIGLLGESLIYAGISPEHIQLQASILRFITFDSAGLLLLVAARMISSTQCETNR